MFKTIALLTASNFFMTFAWYGHLKFKDQLLWKVVLISWLIAFFEYCLQVPANRIGNTYFSLFQLKTLQEVIGLTVFACFAVFFMQETIKWNYIVSFIFLILAVFFMFKKW
jgi:uncharacterized protein (DUF486 family)